MKITRQPIDDSYLEGPSRLRLVVASFVIALCGQGRSAAQQSSQPIAVVTVSVANVDIQSADIGVVEIIGTAAAGQRLWVLNRDSQRTLVIDPKSGRSGWVSNNSVQPINEPLNEMATAEGAFGQAISSANAGNFGQANTYFDQAIATLEKAVAPEHPQIPAILQLKAQMHNRLQEFDQAEASLAKALKLKQTYAGVGHPTSIQCLTELATCYEIQKRYDKAFQTYHQAVKLSTDSVGRKHQQTASMLVQLANLCNDSYRYSDAEASYAEAWETRKQLFGEDHESTQSAAGGLGTVYYYTDQPAKAVEVLSQCRSNLQKMHGSVPPSQTFVLTYLGFAHQSLGDYARAEECLLKNYEIDCNTKGTQSREALNSLHNLATLAVLNDDAKKAEQWFLQCLNGRVQVLGEQHNQTLSTIWSLGNLYLQAGNYEQAETYLVRTLRIAEKIGDVHNDSPYHLGKLYSDTGRHEFAEKLIQSAIDQSAQRKRPSDGHMLTALSEVQVRIGQLDKAIAAQDQARRRIHGYLKQTLTGMPKNKRELFLQKGFASDLHTALTLARMKTDDPQVAAMSAEWLANGKVIGQEVIAEASLLSTPEAAPAIAELQKVRDQLAGIVNQRDIRDPAAKQRLTDLEARQKRLELKVADFGSGRFANQKWTTIDQIRNQLPEKSRFITIAKVRTRDFSQSLETNKWKRSRYLAWIVPPSGDGAGEGSRAVKLVDLGDADAIDADVDSLRKAVTEDFAANFQTSGEKALEKQYRQVATSLSQKVLRPLEEHLTDVNEIILSPDSQLWRVPWEALILANEDYLVESYQLRYVLSGRDLNRTSGPAENTVGSQPEELGVPVVFASPNYDFKRKGQVMEGPKPRLYFSPLPGTAVEAANIKPGIELFAKQTPRMLLGDEALESVFKKLQRPRVLVLSTHGYFLPDRTSSDRASGARSAGSTARPSVAPLLRCGLALAGSNIPSDQSVDDGILTGLEIVGADLRGTELVVLSACETGLGEVRSGEGVAGLRQAFQLAGAESVVSSLWQVSDLETAALMTLFFQSISEGEDKPTALRNAQLSRIESHRENSNAAHPFFWAPFTLTGQP